MDTLVAGIIDSNDGDQQYRLNLLKLINNLSVAAHKENLEKGEDLNKYYSLQDDFLSYIDNDDTKNNKELQFMIEQM